MSDEVKKKYHALDFEDIDAYDMNMIKERARSNFLEKSDPDHGAAAVIEALFAYLYLKGMRIVNDETRKDTWARPTKGWYAEYKPKKNYW